MFHKDMFVTGFLDEDCTTEYMGSTYSMQVATCNMQLAEIKNVYTYVIP